MYVINCAHALGPPDCSLPDAASSFVAVVVPT